MCIYCAVRGKHFAVEDAYTAGRLVKAVKKGLRQVTLNDAATAAVAVTTAYDGWQDALEHSEAARHLAQADLAEDVRVAAKADRFAILPTHADRRITLTPKRARNCSASAPS